MDDLMVHWRWIPRTMLEFTWISVDKPHWQRITLRATSLRLFNGEWFRLIDFACVIRMFSESRAHVIVSLRSTATYIPRTLLHKWTRWNTSKRIKFYEDQRLIPQKDLFEWLKWKRINWYAHTATLYNGRHQFKQKQQRKIKTKTKKPQHNVQSPN